MKSLKELQAQFGDATFRGKTYTFVETADDAMDMLSDRHIYAALAITGEKTEDGDYKLYSVAWYPVNPDAENVEDTCNWDSPDYVEATDYTYSEDGVVSL